MTMKIPTGPDTGARADDDIAALLSAADARIQAQKKGAWEQQGDVAPVVVDLGAELRKRWLWVRPWRSKPVDPPDFSRAEPLGPLSGCRGKASAWRSRVGDPTGPWWALCLDGDPATLDTATIARCWRVWWREQVRVFAELDDLTADAGDGQAAQTWLALTWEEAVRLRGKVTLFPVPGHRDVAKVEAMARDPQAIGYLNAWLRAQGAPRPVPKRASLEAVEMKAAAAVREAQTVLDFARKDLRDERAKRGAARVRLSQGRVATFLGTLGLGARSQADEKDATKAEAGVIAAKRRLREAEADLRHKQDALAEARAKLEKAVRVRLEEEQQAAMAAATKPGP
ncbi:hypothetical protein ASD72_20175 [Pseudoxanthomonas sp. Root630]|nr:hypothetical protein ASD72_20175 [Pseudoxanthomonas sp. Root630]